LAITGEITADSGAIGGWTIGPTALTGTNARLRSTGVLSLGSADGYNTANSIYIDGANTQMSIGSGFRYASDALTIDGSATIGGWSIAADYLSSPTDAIRIGNSQTSGDEIRISADNSGTGTVSYIRMYQESANNYGIEGVDGSTRIFHLGQTGGTLDAEIAGWKFSDTAICQQYAGSAVNNDEEFLTLSTSQNDKSDPLGFSLYRAWDATNASNLRLIRVGQISDLDTTGVFTGGKYGIQIGAGVATQYNDIFRIDQDGALIAGWNFDDTYL